MNNYLELRKDAGKKIYEAGGVELVNNHFVVRSQTDPNTFYTIIMNSCNCPDFAKRGKYFPCKHLHAVSFFLDM
jgi:predicted nucleic acid-binding Zn finger protein